MGNHRGLVYCPTKILSIFLVKPLGIRLFRSFPKNLTTLLSIKLTKPVGRVVRAHCLRVYMRERLSLFVAVVRVVVGRDRRRPGWPA